MNNWKGLQEKVETLSNMNSHKSEKEVKSFLVAIQSFTKHRKPVSTHTQNRIEDTKRMAMDRRAQRSIQQV